MKITQRVLFTVAYDKKLSGQFASLYSLIYPTRLLNEQIFSLVLDFRVLDSFVQSL